jgi:hypothetical protein
MCLLSGNEREVKGERPQVKQMMKELGMGDAILDNGRG